MASIHELHPVLVALPDLHQRLEYVSQHYLTSITYHSFHCFSDISYAFSNLDDVSSSRRSTVAVLQTCVWADILGHKTGHRGRVRPRCRHPKQQLTSRHRSRRRRGGRRHIQGGTRERQVQAAQHKTERGDQPRGAGAGREGLLRKRPHEPAPHMGALQRCPAARDPWRRRFGQHVHEPKLIHPDEGVYDLHSRVRRCHHHSRKSATLFK